MLFAHAVRPKQLARLDTAVARAIIGDRVCRQIFRLGHDHRTLEAIRDPGRLPGDELFRHVEYDDGSDEVFLRRLWRDLYGDEPVTLPGQT